MKHSFNLPLCTMWAMITVVSLWSRHMNPQYLAYFFVAAIVVTVIKG